MKKLLAVIFALLPVLAFAASPNHTAKSTQTKSVKTAVKKVEAKKATTPKTVAKTANKKADAKTALGYNGNNQIQLMGRFAF